MSQALNASVDRESRICVCVCQWVPVFVSVSVLVSVSVFVSVAVFASMAAPKRWRLVSFSFLCYGNVHFGLEIGLGGDPPTRGYAGG